MKASVCMASFNRDPAVLRQVLNSIFAQTRTFRWEVIVVDDGSSYGAPEVCREYPVRYHRIERKPRRRNPAVARNVAYRMARGRIIIPQSDDVVHQGANAIERLCRILKQRANSSVIATVLGCNKEGAPDIVYTGTWLTSFGYPSRKNRRRPYFFLGALWKKHVYAIGGNDEEFTASGGDSWEDRWFARCLKSGLKLKTVYTHKVVGHHMWHPRWYGLQSRRFRINRKVFHKKINEARRTGQWVSSGGPWERNGAGAS